MSELGSILDRLQVLAETAVAGLDAERGIGLVEKLKPEEFPKLWLFNPREEVELLPLQVEQQTFAVILRLATHDETQEALLTKLDAIRDGIRGDRTLNGLVTWTHVSDRELYEDPHSTRKAADLVVVAVDTGGSVYQAEVTTRVVLTSGTSVGTFRTEVIAAVQALEGMSGFAALSSDYVTNRDAIGVAGEALQVPVIPAGFVRDSNSNYTEVECKVILYKHLRETDTETVATSDIVSAVGNLMDSVLFWAALSSVREVTVEPTTTLDGDVTREV